MTLTDLSHGSRARIGHFDKTLDAQTQLRLFAYGLVPGEWVTVVQHKPTTILRIEHAEIAIESQIAACIPVTGESGKPHGKPQKR